MTLYLKGRRGGVNIWQGEFSRKDGFPTHNVGITNVDGFLLKTGEWGKTRDANREGSVAGMRMSWLGEILRFSQDDNAVEHGMTQGS
jgi:hypothetical protein